MSRVYFHSPSGDAELRGSERAWLGGLVDDITRGALSITSADDVDRLKQLIHPGHYLAQKDTTRPGWLRPWAESYEMAFRSGMGASTPLVQYQGKALSTFSFALNTAAVLGNDQLRLATRIHGQCELHAWVDGPNRAWLASIMQAGLDSGIYRKGYWYEPKPGAEKLWQSQGWPEVIELLQARDDEPVVSSYSVCDGFPSSSIGDWMPEWPEGVERDWRALSEEQQTERSERSDAWYDLDEAEQWRISMAGLRESGGGLEIKPGDWDAFRFTHDLSVLDLRAGDWEERLAAAVQRMAEDGVEPEGDDV